MANKFTHAYSLSAERNMTPDEYVFHFDLKQYPDRKPSNDLFCSSCREKTMKTDGDFHKAPMNIRGLTNYISLYYAANDVDSHIKGCEYYSTPIPDNKKYKKRNPEPAETIEEIDKARDSTFARLLRALHDSASDDEDENDGGFIVNNVGSTNYEHHISTHGIATGKSELKIKQRKFEKVKLDIDWFNKLVAIYGKCHIDISIKEKSFEMVEEVNGEETIRTKVYYNRLLRFKSNTEIYQDGNKKDKFSFFIQERAYENIAQEISESGVYKFVIIGYLTKNEDRYINFELFDNDTRNLQFIRIK